MPVLEYIWACMDQVLATEGQLQDVPPHDSPPEAPEFPTADDSGHLPVLTPQVLEVFHDAIAQATQPLTVLDCTLGRGGHASIIGCRLPPGSAYVGLDVDPGNIAYASQRMAEAAPGITFHPVRANFANARAALAGLGIDKADLLLADLGFASNQMDDPARGFSFAADGPLDMRLDPAGPVTAANLVNTLGQDDLANLIYEYGEERLSRKIARKIVEERARQPILHTGELARIVSRAVMSGSGQGKAGRKAGRKGSQAGKSHKQLHPATRTFMALRIAVNGELDALEQLLAALPGLMNPGGVAAIISFHSLEDRMVKQCFASLENEQQATRLTRKPLLASDEEIRENPRSRSAKLRALRFK